jgi:hypothetical protein
LVWFLACSLAGAHGTASEIRPPKPLDRSDRLQTNGRDIVDGRGTAVSLRGVNIGGWLVTEGWMCGQTDDNGRGAIEQLEARFGAEKAARLIAAWQDHWFTSRDLDLIQSWGFNLIRVPFSHRTLLDAEGNWRRRPDGTIDFSRMDWVVDEAGRRGIYVIFDLHVWPRQLEQGQYGLPSRWSDEGKVVREQMRKLWSEVARHYKDNGIIAGFDVINEPEGSPWNAPHHAFHDAIREQDPDRMVIVEWSGYSNTPKEFPRNTVYSDHYAFKDAASLEKYLGTLRDHPDVKVPVFLGEAAQTTVDSLQGGLQHRLDSESSGVVPQVHRHGLLARRLLDQSTVSVGEVAMTCGFYDQSHFTKAFMPHAGLPPQAYRQRSVAQAARGQ